MDHVVTNYSKKKVSITTCQTFLKMFSPPLPLFTLFNVFFFYCCVEFCILYTII